MHPSSVLAASHGLASSLFLGLILTSCCVPFIFLLHFAAPRLEQRLLARLSSPGAGLLFGSILATGYIITALCVLGFPGYVDPCEPLVIIASYFALHGIPVYNTTIAYGPFCFLPFTLAMRGFGTSIPVLKSVVLAGNVALVFVLWKVFRKRLTLSPTIVVVSSILITFLMKQDYVFQIRGDIFIYLAVAMSLLAATSATSLVAILVMGVALALGSGVKITAVLYFLYPLALLYKRHGVKALLGTGALAAALSLAPFAFAAFHLQSYMHWLGAMSVQPRSSKEFFGNIVTSVLLLLPVVLVTLPRILSDWRGTLRLILRGRFSLTPLLLGMLVTDILSAKFGAGRHHLVPFAILSAYATVDIYFSTRQDGREEPRSLVATYLWGLFAVVMLTLATSQAADVWKVTRTERQQAIALHREVDTLLRELKDRRVDLGDGLGQFALNDRYSATYAAPQIVFSGQSYRFDLSAEADRELMKLPFNPENLEYVRHCRSDVWLIPRGEVPFLTRSIYSGMYPLIYPGHRLFPDDFRTLFQQTYIRSGSSQFFDLYVCRNLPEARR